MLLGHSGIRKEVRLVSTRAADLTRPATNELAVLHAPGVPAT
jgi:hypothetical protein